MTGRAGRHTTISQSSNRPFSVKQSRILTSRTSSVSKEWAEPRQKLGGGKARPRLGHFPPETGNPAQIRILEKSFYTSRLWKAVPHPKRQSPNSLHYQWFTDATNREVGQELAIGCPSLLSFFPHTAIALQDAQTRKIGSDREDGETTP